MKHLIVKDRNLRKKLKKLDKKIMVGNFMRTASKLNINKISNRCVITGRGRAVSQFFKQSRIVIRENALKGKYPGVVKSS